MHPDLKYHLRSMRMDALRIVDAVDAIPEAAFHAPPHDPITALTPRQRKILAVFASHCAQLNGVADVLDREWATTSQIRDNAGLITGTLSVKL